MNHEQREELVWALREKFKREARACQHPAETTRPVQERDGSWFHRCGVCDEPVER
jgi:hypothetical protein